ncbi:MAG: hypothetical protein EBU40_00455 [Proteobacteria bacterium]|nr:hypothetical protein [Pseudomonadota bacterium]NBT18429.1 hypothetical protein [Pseudomonadota bacterium]
MDVEPRHLAMDTKRTGPVDANHLAHEGTHQVNRVRCLLDNLASTLGMDPPPRHGRHATKHEPEAHCHGTRAKRLVCISHGLGIANLITDA